LRIADGCFRQIDRVAEYPGQFIPQFKESLQRGACRGLEGHQQIHVAPFGVEVNPARGETKHFQALDMVLAA
jgi:hypothetical protein